MKPSRPAKNRVKKNEGGPPNLPAFRKSASAPTKMTRVLPMQLRVGDRLATETGEVEVIAPPYSTAGGRIVHARVQRINEPNNWEIRNWDAAKRISVRRPNTDEGKG